MKEKVEGITKWGIYEASLFETLVRSDAQIRHYGCVSVYFGAWSNESLGTSFALKPLTGKFNRGELMGRRSILVTSCVCTTKVKQITKK